LNNSQKEFFDMKNIRIAGILAASGLAVLFTGCVVAPIGRPVAYYPAVRPVYVEPAPVVVVPAPYYGYRGYRHWR
jgi:hypothetical protein